MGSATVRSVCGILSAMLLFLFASRSVLAFSVLAHQGIVDEAWDKTLVPAIKQRFPNATPAQLAEAHDYARGGSHLPDLGYFPLGSHLFTDLLHYVRTGDFISCLLREANSPQQYAFALGMLAHYEADINGHSQAVNLAVPIIYHQLEEKYGESVNYAESPSAHLATEFRFDVLQVAHRGEIPGLLEHSLDFKVPSDCLDRALRETYGLGLKDIFKDYSVALTTYRWGFRTLINEGTGIAWQLYREQIQAAEPGITSQQFVQHISRKDFIQDFGNSFLEPGSLVRFVGWVGNLIPNIGPLRRLPFKPLPPEVQQLYFAAFHNAYHEYVREVAAVADDRAVLPNIILDTGQRSAPGEYGPADRAYLDLLELHAKDNFAHTAGDLMKDLVEHFRDPNTALAFEHDNKKRAEAFAAISELKGAGAHIQPELASAGGQP
jgi:hypothetical protein